MIQQAIMADGVNGLVVLPDKHVWLVFVFIPPQHLSQQLLQNLEASVMRGIENVMETLIDIVFMIQLLAWQDYGQLS